MIAIDLFCGLGGWAEGLLAEGFDVVGYDIESHEYGDERYPAELIIQDVLTLHGSQFKDAALIVASPPCQEYSYMAMPWKRAKAKAAAIRADETGAALERLNRLFNACFRIQKEASIAAGRHIPMIVENVRGAIPWVGRSRWNFGSFHLWGDVPALMPVARRIPGHGIKRTGRTMCYPAGSANPDAVKGRTGKLHWQDDPRAHRDGQKLPGNNAPRMWSERRIQRLADGLRYDEDAFYCGSSGSMSRKAASAMIAKIPFALSRHIAATFRSPHA